MTNTTTLIDSYIGQNNKFMKLKDKAQKCIDCDSKINEIRSKSNNIIRDVLVNFSPDRKRLGIFIIKKGYSDNNGKNPSIITDEKKLPKDNRWHYEELCVNKMGFSLLSIYGVKSVSILDTNTDDEIYYLSMLKDKRIMTKLKDILNEDKLNLLDKVLQDIELLRYDNIYEKKQVLVFYKLKSSNGIFKGEKTKSNSIKIRLGNGSCKCMLQEDDSTFYGESSKLESLDIDSGLVIEQVRDEVLCFLNEVYIDITTKKEVMTEYLTKLEERFNNELIVLALQTK